MQIIESRTEFQTIQKNDVVKVTAPLFAFKNNGNTNLRINGLMLEPGEIWGVDNSTFLATAMATGVPIDVQEATEFTIEFSNAAASVAELARFGFVRKWCILITTKYIRK